MDTPRPTPRTNRTRRVPHPVLIGHDRVAPPTPRLARPRYGRGRCHKTSQNELPPSAAALCPSSRPPRPPASGCAFSRMAAVAPQLGFCNILSTFSGPLPDHRAGVVHFGPRGIAQVLQGPARNEGAPPPSPRCKHRPAAPCRLLTANVLHLSQPLYILHLSQPLYIFAQEGGGLLSALPLVGGGSDASCASTPRGEHGRRGAPRPPPPSLPY